MMMVVEWIWDSNHSILNACGANKWTVPNPVLPIKIVVFFLQSFKWFSITNKQLMMLLDGNTCNNKKIFEEFYIEPVKFDKNLLEYLNN